MTKDMVGLNDERRTLLVNVHTVDQCAGQACCIHNPSNHHMAAWTPEWDGLFKQMWRQCPHQMVHPDPDDLAYQRKRWGVQEASVAYLHPCDGCCQPPPPVKEIEGATDGGH